MFECFVIFYSRVGGYLVNTSNRLHVKSQTNNIFPKFKSFKDFPNIQFLNLLIIALEKEYDKTLSSNI